MQSVIIENVRVPGAQNGVYEPVANKVSEAPGQFYANSSGVTYTATPIPVEDTEEMASIAQFNAQLDIAMDPAAKCITALHTHYGLLPTENGDKGPAQLRPVPPVVRVLVTALEHAFTLANGGTRVTFNMDAAHTPELTAKLREADRRLAAEEASVLQGAWPDPHASSARAILSNAPRREKTVNLAHDAVASALAPLMGLVAIIAEPLELQSDARARSRAKMDYVSMLCTCVRRLAEGTTLVRDAAAAGALGLSVAEGATHALARALGGDEDALVMAGALAFSHEAARCKAPPLGIKQYIESPVTTPALDYEVQTGRPSLPQQVQTGLRVLAQHARPVSGITGETLQEGQRALSYLRACERSGARCLSQQPLYIGQAPAPGTRPIPVSAGGNARGEPSAYVTRSACLVGLVRGLEKDFAPTQDNKEWKLAASVVWWMMYQHFNGVDDPSKATDIVVPSRSPLEICEDSGIARGILQIMSKGAMAKAVGGWSDTDAVFSPGTAQHLADLLGEPGDGMPGPSGEGRNPNLLYNIASDEGSGGLVARCIILSSLYTLLKETQSEAVEAIESSNRVKGGTGPAPWIDDDGGGGAALKTWLELTVFREESSRRIDEATARLLVRAHTEIIFARLGVPLEHETRQTNAYERVAINLAASAVYATGGVRFARTTNDQTVYASRNDTSWIDLADDLVGKISNALYDVKAEIPENSELLPATISKPVTEKWLLLQLMGSTETNKTLVASAFTDSVDEKERFSGAILMLATAIHTGFNNARRTEEEALKGFSDSYAAHCSNLFVATGYQESEFESVVAQLKVHVKSIQRRGPFSSSFTRFDLHSTYNREKAIGLSIGESNPPDEFSGTVLRKPRLDLLKGRGTLVQAIAFASFVSATSMPFANIMWTTAATVLAFASKNFITTENTFALIRHGIQYINFYSIIGLAAVASQFAKTGDEAALEKAQASLVSQSANGAMLVVASAAHVWFMNIGDARLAEANVRVGDEFIDLAYSEGVAKSLLQFDGDYERIANAVTYAITHMYPLDSTSAASDYYELKEGTKAEYRRSVAVIINLDGETEFEKTEGTGLYDGKIDELAELISQLIFVQTDDVDQTGAKGVAKELIRRIVDDHDDPDNSFEKLSDFVRDQFTSDNNVFASWNPAVPEDTTFTFTVNEATDIIKTALKRMVRTRPPSFVTNVDAKKTPLLQLMNAFKFVGNFANTDEYIGNAKISGSTDDFKNELYFLNRFDKGENDPMTGAEASVLERALAYVKFENDNESESGKNVILARLRNIATRATGPVANTILKTTSGDYFVAKGMEIQAATFSQALMAMEQQPNDAWVPSSVGTILSAMAASALAYGYAPNMWSAGATGLGTAIVQSLRGMQSLAVVSQVGLMQITEAVTDASYLEGLKYDRSTGSFLDITTRVEVTANELVGEPDMVATVAGFVAIVASLGMVGTRAIRAFAPVNSFRPRVERVSSKLTFARAAGSSLAVLALLAGVSAGSIDALDSFRVACVRHAPYAAMVALAPTAGARLVSVIVQATQGVGTAQMLAALMSSETLSAAATVGQIAALVGALMGHAGANSYFKVGNASMVSAWELLSGGDSGFANAASTVAATVATAGAWVPFSVSMATANIINHAAYSASALTGSSRGMALPVFAEIASIWRDRTMSLGDAITRLISALIVPSSEGYMLLTTWGFLAATINLPTMRVLSLPKKRLTASDLLAAAAAAAAVGVVTMGDTLPPVLLAGAVVIAYAGYAWGFVRGMESDARMGNVALRPKSLSPVDERRVAIVWCVRT